MAKKLGFPEGIPVSTAIIDAHAGVPGVGAADPGTLVMVCGTSSCHMLNAVEYHRVPGVAGVVKDGILPGMYGYEAGQAAVGDAFDWLRRLTGQKTFAQLGRRARTVPPGADGVLCVDWFNGCRTPLMDGNLRGGFFGLTLRHEPHHLYRALLESSALGLRWIVDLLRERGVPVKKFIATGGPAPSQSALRAGCGRCARREHPHPSVPAGAGTRCRDLGRGGCGQACWRLQFSALGSAHDRGRAEGCQRSRRHSDRAGSAALQAVRATICAISRSCRIRAAATCCNIRCRCWLTCQHTLDGLH